MNHSYMAQGLMKITKSKDYQTIVLIVFNQLQNFKERHQWDQTYFYLHKVKVGLRSSRSFIRNWVNFFNICKRNCLSCMRLSNGQSSALWFQWLYHSRTLGSANHGSCGETCDRARTRNLVRTGRDARTLESKLFHSIIVEEKYLFLKKL